MAFFDKLKDRLKRTGNSIAARVNELFKSFVRVDEELLSELEELLICADTGVQTTEEILDKLRDAIKEERITESEKAYGALKKILRQYVGEASPVKLDAKPSVILVIGVNGVGKTTSIGKIASQLVSEGKRVVVAAADTFRAAAIEQLEIWCGRAGAELIKQSGGSDPAAVVFDAAAAAKKRGADVLIVDTAGRLQNKKNLMDELAKINRVLLRELPDADRETLLVLDSTTGQNAVIQAKEFKNAADISGIVLTKLDGTAKGGVIFSVRRELDIPVKFIGVGEGIDDLRPFDPDEFIEAMFEN